MPGIGPIGGRRIGRRVGMGVVDAEQLSALVARRPHGLENVSRIDEKTVRSLGSVLGRPQASYTGFGAPLISQQEATGLPRIATAGLSRHPLDELAGNPQRFNRRVHGKLPPRWVAR